MIGFWNQTCSAVRTVPHTGPITRLVGTSAAIAVICIVPLTGCGPRGPAVQPVEGVVTIDGNPLAGAMVMFWPVAGGPPAAGSSNAEGRYVLTTPTAKAGAGALAADYAVTVEKYEDWEDTMKPAPKDPEGFARWQAEASRLAAERASKPVALVTPKAYANREAPVLSATVKPGRNKIDLELKSDLKAVTAK
jgi:hypothetical protein